MGSLGLGEVGRISRRSEGGEDEEGCILARRGRGEGDDGLILLLLSRRSLLQIVYVCNRLSKDDFSSLQGKTCEVGSSQREMRKIRGRG